MSWCSFEKCYHTNDEIDQLVRGLQSEQDQQKCISNPCSAGCSCLTLKKVVSQSLAMRQVFIGTASHNVSFYHGMFEHERDRLSSCVPPKGYVKVSKILDLVLCQFEVGNFHTPLKGQKYTSLT